jgi:hypothetical protein
LIPEGVRAVVDEDRLRQVAAKDVQVLQEVAFDMQA